MHIGSVQDKNIIVEIKCNNVDIPCQLMYDIDYSCVPNVVDDWVFVGYSPCNTTSCDSVGWQSASKFANRNIYIYLIYIYINIYVYICIYIIYNIQ